MYLDVQTGGFWSPLNHAALGFVKTIQPHDVRNIILAKQNETKQKRNFTILYVLKKKKPT